LKDEGTAREADPAGEAAAPSAVETNAADSTAGDTPGGSDRAERVAEPTDARAESSADEASSANDAPSPRVGPEASTSASPAAPWAKWAFAIVPLVGLIELGAHFVQTSSVVPDADWKAARQVVEKKLRPEDLLLFAPKWEDPVGRAEMGDGLASLARTARPDESRFPRAVEVSARGKHRPELEGWKLLEEERVGRLTVGVYENPNPAKVLDDLLRSFSPERLVVSRVDGGKETPCGFVRGRTQSGGLGSGPAIPGDRFQCDGSFVGPTIVHALDHDPRACLFAPPLGGNAVLRVRFKDVRFGKALHGHHALQNEAERDKIGVPVTVVFRTDAGIVGRAEHKDGMGWAGFEFSTQELEGKVSDLVVEITAANATRRPYCFEADTR
jgi:hypothetical protein